MLLETILSKLDPDVMNIINHDCQQYIADVHNDVTNIKLLRGIKKLTDLPLQKFNTDNSRNPTDTARLLSNIIDNIYKQEFGIKFRSNNIVFCTGNYSFASGYGKVAVIFPIGKYDYLFSDKFNDMSMYIDKVFATVDMDHLCKKAGIAPDDQPDVEDAISDIIEYGDINPLVSYDVHHVINLVHKLLHYLLVTNGGLHFNNNLIDGIKSGNEIMIKCQSYYAVPYSIF